MTSTSPILHNARIAWFSHNAQPPSDNMVIALADAGMQIVDWARKRPDTFCDIALLDVRGAETPVHSAIDLSELAKRLFIPGGLIVTASQSIETHERAALRKIGDVCFTTASHEPLIGVLRERLRLASLAEETGERLKTLVSMGCYFRFPPINPEDKRPSVLLAGVASPLTLSASNAVREWAGETACVFSAGQVMRALDHTTFDAAIFIPEDENDLLLALARALRRHRQHRRSPVLLTSKEEGLVERLTARDGFDCVLPDHLDSDLAPRIHLSVRRASMAATMRQFLHSADGAAGKPLTAVNAKFFAQHAVRLYQRANDTNRPLTLIGLSIESSSSSLARNELTGAVGRAIKTVARIIRAEDMVARLTPTMLVVLASTTEKNSTKIAERLDGVVSGTLSRAIIEQSRITTQYVVRTQNESVEESLARLIGLIKNPAEETGTVS
ncbi:MAG: hypothetical protein R3C40_01650 [Parvularculaceae bacterium]